MHSKRLAARAIIACVGLVCVGSSMAPASTQGVSKRVTAVAFDYLVLFNPDSIVSAVDQVAPGKGRDFTALWRTRQFEYCWLRSMTDRYVDFEREFGHLLDDLVAARAPAPAGAPAVAPPSTATPG